MHSYRSGFVQNVFGEFLFYESDENANNVGLTKETFDKMDKIKCYLSLSILAIFVNKIFVCSCKKN